MSFIPYAIGGIVALGIHDYGGKTEVKHKNPFKDMAHSVKEILKDSKARTYLASYIIGKEMTHSQI